METSMPRQSHKQSLREFYEKSWSKINPDQPFKGGWHIDAICLHLEALTKGTISRLAISGPNGIGFTSLCAIAFPAWLESVTAPVAVIESNSAFAKRTRLKHAELGCKYVKTASLYEQWDIDNIETLGACVIDTEMGLADAQMLKWRDQFDHDLTQIMRRTDGPVLLFGPRCHDDDIVGRLVRTGGWEHLVLPALYEAEHAAPPTSIGWVDPRTLEDDELPCFTVDGMADMNSYLSTETFNTRYQQRPPSELDSK